MPHWIESFDYILYGIPLSVDCTVDEVRSNDGKDYEIEVSEVLCGDSRVDFAELTINDKPLTDLLSDECRERLKTEIAA